MNEIKETVKRIDETQVPTLISEQFTILREYTSSLEKARKKADEVNQEAVQSQKKGVKLLRRKRVIEKLQSNQVALSESNKINMELQEKSLEYQKKISEIMQYLFGLGVANINMNRCIVRELMMRLENASEEEIDEMAREEILKVIKQLKAQEDLYKKNEEITAIIRKNENRISDIEYKNLEYNLYINQLVKNDEEIKQIINNLEKKSKKRLIIELIIMGCLVVGLIALALLVIIK